MNIELDINNIINMFNEKLSIIVKNINKEEYIYRYNSDKRVISASLIKVPIMLTVFEKVKLGELNLNSQILVKDEDILDDTEVFESGEGYYSLEELVNWMIIESDNTATNVIIDILGFKEINDFIRNTMNLKSTCIQRKMLDQQAIKNGFNNYTNQEDMLEVFEGLFKKDILTEELCEKSIEILYNQRCQNQVMRYIYEPVKYAHKTGALDYLNHDVGIMNINNENFYIGVSVYDSKNIKGNKKLTGIIGKEIYEYLKNITNNKDR